MKRATSMRNAMFSMRPPLSSFRLSSVVILSWALLACTALAQKPPKEEKPQVLELAPEAPATVTAETARFAYLHLPVQRRGLLSRQVEESMKDLRKLARKKRILRINAWVAGAGDVRRVSSSIRELLSEWKMQIPAITVVRVGALPDRASRVAFEVEVEEEREVNPQGLVFLAGARNVAPQFQLDIRQQLGTALNTLEERLRETGSGNEDALAVRCFVSLTQDLPTLEGLIRKRFPGASVHAMQAVRADPDSYANCDLVARLKTPPADAFEAKVVTPVDGSAPVTAMVKVNTPRIVLTSAQLGFRATDADLALAFERLEGNLQEQELSLKSAARLEVLAQSPDLASRSTVQGRKFLNPRYDPAILRQTIEGLPALDATISLSAIVARP